MKYMVYTLLFALPSENFTPIRVPVLFCCRILKVTNISEVYAFPV